MMLRLADDVRFRRVLDEGVLLRLGNGEILGLNGVGARVVELLSKDRADRPTVAERLRQEMEVQDERDVEAEVGAFVDELVEAGVLYEETQSAESQP